MGQLDKLLLHRQLMQWIHDYISQLQQPCASVQWHNLPAKWNG